MVGHTKKFFPYRLLWHNSEFILTFHSIHFLPSLSLQNVAVRVLVMLYQTDREKNYELNLHADSCTRDARGFDWNSKDIRTLHDKFLSVSVIQIPFLVSTSITFECYLPYVHVRMSCQVDTRRPAQGQLGRSPLHFKDQPMVAEDGRG